MDTKVTEVMDSLKGMSRAEVPAFFTNRVLQRISNRPIPGFLEKFAQLIARPSVAFTLVAFLLLLNAICFSGYSTPAESISAFPGFDFSFTEYAVAENENLWP